MSGKWIPVTERLPEYGEAVLTIAQDDVYEVNHIVDDVHGEWFWEDNGKVLETFDVYVLKDGSATS